MQTLTSLPFVALTTITTTQIITALISSKIVISPKLKHFFISFAVGALLGNAFVHILPIAFIFNPKPLFISNMMLLGILLNFFTEKTINIYNFYAYKKKQNNRAIRVNHFIMDLIHSGIIGATIVSAYQQSSSLGVSTSLALGFISIAQILSTTNIMRHHGINKKETLTSFIITSLATIISGIFINYYNISIEKIDHILLPIGAGMFIYLALRKLIPELHDEVHLAPSIMQAFILLLGIYIMYLIPTPF